MEFKGKKLNNKGFTLIELLAVVVILALLMSISVTSVLSAMNNSRISTLHTNASAFANWYNETVAQDELLSSSDRTIGSTSAQTIAQDNAWHCLEDVPGQDTTENLATLYDLSSNDFVLGSIAPVAELDASVNPTGKFVVSSSTCSAIRTNEKGKIEVLLVAKTDGRYNVNSYRVTYAISSEENGCTGASKICKDY